jgi:hypothetical protein
MADALARALLVHARGGSEDEAVEAVLATDGDEEAAALRASAEGLAGNQ